MCRFLVITVFFVATSVSAAEQSLKTAVDPLIDASCLHCHDGSSESKLNFAELGADLSDESTFRQWGQVFDRVNAGEMPPPSETQPNPAVRIQTLASLKALLKRASLKTQLRQGRVPSRRLTKLELGYTLQDLLLISGDVTDGVPEEIESGRFDTIGASQRISALHLESYLQAADKAFDLAFQLSADPRRNEEFDLLDNVFMNAFHDLPLAMGGSVTRRMDDGVAMFIDADYLTRATNFGFHVETPGTYRITSTVSSIQSKDPVTAKLILRRPGGEAVLLGAVDLLPEATETLVVSTFLTPGDDFYLTLDMGQTVKRDYAALVSAGGAKDYKGKGILIKQQRVEGPLSDSWPPASTEQLIGSMQLLPSEDSSDEMALVSPTKPIEEHLNEILKPLAERAFRGPVSDEEYGSLIKACEPAIQDGREAADVLRVALRTMLSSPRFVFMGSGAGEMESYALASRLSYFLWKSLPDEELLELAASGEMRNSDVLHRQVERLLSDEKANRFYRDFPRQWLRLNKVNATTPDKALYPEFDELLGHAIPLETEFFFKALVQENLSAARFIDSGFTFLNSRLARHYGFEEVTGQEFRRFDLPQDSERGGVLTHAAVLKTTANGTVTSPVIRGNFVLTNFLGTPPASPPPSAGAVEPDTQGRITIREILAAHRDSATCRQCHAEIDPPGFALESFDPIGGFRTHYRASAGKRYKIGPEVDATGVTSEGQPFSGIREFRTLLLRRKRGFVKNFVSQLVVYSTGAEIQFADRECIDEILESTEANGFRVKDIVHEIVASRLFRNW